ncbi:MAG: hypothetical protein ABSF38_08555 [Verrucomicrobiota bacterium]|jgi:hypothetical protein
MTTSHEKQQEKQKSSRPPALPVLVGHVLATLPDSLARREEVLRALAEFIPPGEGSGLCVRMLQFHLQEHQKLRLGCLGAAGRG